MIVGVLGGGQLGRMLGLAGIPLGLRFRFLDHTPQAPAGAVGELMVGEADDARCLDQFADGLAVATYEFENISLTTARFLERRLGVHPSSQALETAQDRLFEKELFSRLGIPTARFAQISSPGDFAAALEAAGLPAILKTRRLGYDGKGQMAIRTPEELPEAWNALGGVPSLLEGFVQFEREVSILAVRSSTGETKFYPLVENTHLGGILRISRSQTPPLTAELQALAESHASRVLDALDYVGVLAIEFFQSDGTLVANEMAPRVHNSGHWTIEGAETSQFENHLRAILGWPLGSTAPRGHSAMVNLIGTIPDRSSVLAIPGARLHLYDKEPKPGRKLGHVTLVADSPTLLAERLAQLGPLVA